MAVPGAVTPAQVVTYYLAARDGMRESQPFAARGARTVRQDEYQV